MDDIELIPGELGEMPAKKMCKECPLNRGSIPGYLGGYTPEQYIRMMMTDASVACHMSKGFHERRIDLQRHCTGVAHFRANVHKMPRAGGAAQAVTTAGPNHEECFSTPVEFIAHHQQPEGSDYWGGVTPQEPSGKELPPPKLDAPNVSMDAALLCAYVYGGVDALIETGKKFGLSMSQVFVRLAWLERQDAEYQQRVMLAVTTMEVALAAGDRNG